MKRIKKGRKDPTISIESMPGLEPPTSIKEVQCRVVMFVVRRTTVTHRKRKVLCLPHH